MNKLIFYITIILFLFFASCAQIGTLSGGEKDTQAPILLKSTPKQQTKNFKGTKLTFKFDEFFILNDLNSVFISSPPLLEKPTFKVKRKKFIVEFNEKLKDTTTYMFWFANAIQDNNERNPYKDFKFVFSTGDNIDTMEISGIVKDAKTNEPEKEMYVMLYRNFNDSTPINQKPYYIAKTDTSGKFTLDFLKTGKYKIFALKDNDVNLQFNLPNEKIAFLDSLIVPEVTTETKIDTFLAGSVLHQGDSLMSDTLINDTIITHNKYIYSPKNITLFSFEEDNDKQYILNSLRDTKGKCKIDFNKEIETIRVQPYNFELKNDDYLTEKTDTGKSLIYWIKNKDIYKKDTLSFLVSYFNKDSADNIIEENDTIDFSFNFEKDTIKHFVVFNELNTKQDSFANYFIETSTPIRKIDTSKIHLFQILDTLVLDTREQKLVNYSRPAPNKLSFKLKRPFVKEFFIESINDTTSSWFTAKYTADSTTLNCTIKDKTLFEQDTIKVILHYDNAFFKGQIHKKKDTLSLALNKQRITSVLRPATDTIEIKFNKEINDSTSIKLSENNIKNWFKRVNTDEKNIFLIKITNKEIENTDTLILMIKTQDYENNTSGKTNINFSKIAIFRFSKQRIVKKAREERNQFYFVLKKPLINDFEIDPLNFSLKIKWYEKRISKSKDTVVFSIFDRKIARLDTIQLAIKYNVLNRFKKIETVNDTVAFVYKRVRERRKRTSKKNNTKKETKVKEVKNESNELKNVSINIPVEFELKKDSLSERKFKIKHKWKTGISYFLNIDSMAFTDVYNDYSKSKDVTFKIRGANSYSNLQVKLQNINSITKQNFYLNLKTENDTTILDTAIQKISTIENFNLSTIKKGQIIISLYDKDKKLIKNNFTNSDSTFNFIQLVPGKYFLKVVYDKNKNKKWDTGKYIKHIQPERIIYYSKEIILKENENIEIEWDLKN